VIDDLQSFEAWRAKHSLGKTSYNDESKSSTHLLGITVTQHDSPAFIDSVDNTAKKTRRQVAFAERLTSD